jgi:sugar phosphate isomerase/epimerase
MTNETNIGPPATDRLAIHTCTNRPLSLEQCIEAYQAAGIAAMSVWRETIAPIGLASAAALVRRSGLRVPALVRGGFFVSADAAARSRALDENRRCLEEAKALGAEMLVLVAGAQPGVDLADARAMVADALANLAREAEAGGVRLALEPLHPMYAADRSCVNTLETARVICDAVDDPRVGVAVDVYHVWWEPELDKTIAALGERGKLFALHVCDWKVDTRDLLTDRGLMGEGCIPIRRIRGWMQKAGFDGIIEVEIFSERYWAEDQRTFIEAIKRAYREHA